MDFNQIWMTEFNITPKFYNYLTVIIPSAFIWLTLPIGISYINKSNCSNIPWSILNCSKICFTIIFLFVTTFYLYIQNSFLLLTLNSVSLILSGCLVYYNRLRGIQSSGILFIYWFLIWLMNLSEFFNYISKINTNDFNLLHYDFTKFERYEIIITVLSSILLILQSFADKKPKTYKYKTIENLSPEHESGIISTLLFKWFNIIIYSNKKECPLTEECVWNLDYEHTSKVMVPKFEKNWNNLKTVQGNNSILITLIKTFGMQFLFTAFLRFLMNIIFFVFPMILRQLIIFAESDKQLIIGIIYANSLMFFSLLLTFIMNYYMHKSSIIGLGIQTSLINSIYKKTLKISGYDKSDIGKITDLMAVDCRGFVTLIPLLNMIWAAPLTVLITVYFLIIEFQWLATLIGIIVLSLLMIPINKIVAEKLVKHQNIQMKNKDKKMNSIIEILNGIKVIKLYNWESYFQKLVENVRNDEMRTLRTIEFYNSGKYFITLMTPFLVSLSTFVTFILIDEKNVLTVEKVFVALSLFNIIQYPLSLVSLLISTCARTSVSLKRIENFLNKPEIEKRKIVEDNDKVALNIENGTFRQNDQIILKNINCVINKGQSVAIVGPVGSGKSSFLLAVLGELECDKGTMNTYGSITYLPQQPWIQQTSLEANILFGKPKNSKFYQKVIKACALQEDFNLLPDRDQTIIGEKGINLSGGQKQRVALARAIYSDTSIYLLDDPLSSVDTHVANHIFNNVIGPNGILANKTRIFVTNNSKHMKDIDIIIGLENGKITDKQIDKIISDAEIILNSEDSDVNYQNIHTIHGRSKDSPASDVSSLSNNSADEPLLVKRKKKILIKDEHIETGKVTYRVYLQYFKNIGYILVPTIFIFNLISHCMSILSNFWLSKWASNNSNGSDNKMFYISGYCIIGLLQSLALSLTCVLLAIGCLRAAKILHEKMMSKVLKLPLMFFETTPSGRIINRFSIDINSMDEILPTSIREWLSVLLMITLILLLWISTISWYIVIPVVIILFFYFYILKLHLSISRQLRRFESATKSPIHSHFIESLTGSLIIKASNQEERFIEELEIKVNHNHKFTYYFLVAGRWLSVRLELLAILIIYVVAILLVIYRYKISVTIFALCLNYCLQIIAQLNQLVRTSSALESNIIAVERINEYIELPDENNGFVQSKMIINDLPTEGEIDIKNISVRYDGDTIDILKNFTLTIKQGEKIGITGRTGSGKSTLASVILRTVKLTNGTITLKNQNIENVSLHQLRSAITLIHQDIVLFTGTLRMNLDPLNLYKDNEIWRILELVHMYEFVKSFPEKIYMNISDKGNNLSLGQKQLLCLARALLRKTKIFILDEISSAVDMQTENLIQDVLNQEFKDVTVITIAHRIQSLRNCNRIIVLEHGEIIESDTLNNLLKNEQSNFYSLAKESGYFENIN